MTAVPMQMIKPPTNMPTRRPKRSLEEGKVDHAGRNEGRLLYVQAPAKKEPIIVPTLNMEKIIPVAGFCGQPMANFILDTPELSTDILFPRLVPLVKRSVYARIPLIPFLKERVAVHEGGYKDKTSKYARLT